jgi:uncharacterized protein involved in exopolysaccharide biosynthesis
LPKINAVNEFQTTPLAHDGEIDLRNLIKELWAGKLVIILCSVVAAALSVAYALLATQIYRSQASVQIREENRAGLSSQMGGLAALAGISFSGRDQNRELALTALKSRVVIQRMIEEENLLPILYADDWDTVNKSWATPKPPTPWKAYEFFMNNVLSVSVDKTSGIVTVGMEWKDPALAAAWVKSLILRVNTFVNDATIREAEQNLKFLDQQAQATPMVELKKTIFSMMEGEIKRLMVARNPETAPLRVIDPPVVAERRVRPKRSLIAILGTFAGGMLGAIIVLVRSALRT